VENGINTVHLSYVRQGVGHALIGARQWIPAEQVADADTAASMGVPPDLPFRTKGELAIDICREAYADGASFDVICGDEVYGGCARLREFFEQQRQASVLRVACTFMFALGDGVLVTCRQAVRELVGEHQWEVRSAGAGSKGQRWYAWSSPPPVLIISCWSAVTCAPAIWHSTTATCPMGGRA
jgi:hypothetical protein